MHLHKFIISSSRSAFMDAAPNSLKEDSVSECISQTNLTFCFRSSWGQKSSDFYQDVKHISASILATVIPPSLVQPGVEECANIYIYKM